MNMQGKTGPFLFFSFFWLPCWNLLLFYDMIKKNSKSERSAFMLCTLIDIRGDYGFVRYEDTGVVSEVAMALLPFGVDVGDRLKFENYEFTRA